jgi:hypothetical protein
LYSGSTAALRVLLREAKKTGLDVRAAFCAGEEAGI